jgi:hypothetical protein
MKPIKKFSTEMNQPKSILESIDSKALEELIKGMGFNDIHELKREKNLLSKLEALMKEIDPKNNISEDDAEDIEDDIKKKGEPKKIASELSEDDAEDIEDDIKKKGEPKSLEDKDGEKEPETAVGKTDEIEEDEESEDKEETEEESDEDEVEVEVEDKKDSDKEETEDKVEVEVEVEDSDKEETKDDSDEDDSEEVEEESVKTPKATRRIMTFEDFVKEGTTTVNKNVSYRDDEEEEDNAVPVADSLNVNEAEIKSDEEFKEYAFAVLKNAFGADFDETKAQEVVDGLTSKYSGDYGAMVGALQSSLD